MKKFLPFLFLSVHLFAQPTADPGGLRRITVRDGLPSSEVYFIMQDNKGYLWMTTDAGVCRYNGFSFEVFTTADGLTDNTVFTLVQDSAGKIWAQGFSGAVSWFDGKKFNPVPVNDTLKLIYANGKKFGYCLNTDAKGGVSFGGLYTDGCYRIGPEDQYAHAHFLKPAALGDACRGAWTTPENKLMAYSRFESCDNYCRIQNGSQTVSILLPAVSEPATNNRFLLLHNHSVLFSFSTYLFSIDPSGRVVQHTFPAAITGLDEDRAGNVWVSLFYGGTEMFTKGNLNAAPQIFLQGKTVSKVFEDNENGYWFCTIGEGVLYRPDLSFHYLTPSEGLPENSVSAIAPYVNGKMLVGLPNGKLGILDPSLPQQQFHFFREEPGTFSYTDIPVDALIALHDTIVTSDYYFRFLSPGFKTLYSCGPVGHAKGVIQNPVNGRLLFFSYSALYWLKDDHSFDSVQIAKVRFTAMCYAHDGTLWMGALNGLWKFGVSQPVYMGDSFPTLHARIDAMAEDRKNTLWVATRGEGVFAIAGKKVFHFTMHDQLSSNTCRAITVADDGTVWVGTNRGVSMISGFDPASGNAKIRSFGSANGLLDDEIKCIAFSAGKIWMGGNGGMCWINTAQLMDDTVPPAVYITQVLSGEKKFRADTVADFSYDDKTIRFFCEGICFRDPSSLRYRYRLFGTGSGWINTADREISFTGLPAGNYVLEVFAVNGDGYSSRNPAVFSFHVAPPVWKTWWFILGESLALVAAIWMIAGYRIRRQRRRAEEKTETERRMAELRLSALRAQMNPHFIFNAINSIQHFVLKNDSEQAYNYLAKFSRLIRLVLDQSRSDSVTPADEVKMLQLYLDLEKLRFEQPFRFELDIDDDLLDDDCRIPGMLVQPFVENAIWHGLLPKKEGEAILSVRFTRENDELVIRVEDNGIGRKAASAMKKAEAHRSFGLLITEERMRLLRTRKGGQTSVTVTDKRDESGNAAGTLAEIRIRLEN